MKNIYIHIGMQKTGSTWLQNNYFPKIESHDVICKQSFRHLFYDLNPDKDLIITYENYVGYPHPLPCRAWNGWMDTRDSAFKNLSSFFPSADIVLVIRRQPDFIKSLYNQYVKVGGNITFDDYWTGDCFNSFEKGAIKYTDLVQQIDDNFKGRILVLDFDLFVNDKKRFSEVLNGFFGQVNTIDLTESYQSLVNKSLRWKDIRALLSAYKLFGNKYHPNARIKLHRRLFKALRWVSVNFYSAFFSNETAVSEEHLKSIEAYYSDDWTAITSLMKGGYFIKQGDKISHDF